MNRLARNSLLPLVAGLWVTPAAMALDSVPVPVTATVAPTCKFVTGGSVAFSLDPSSAAAANGVVTQPAFWCTKGTAYTIVDDLGLNEVGTTFRMSSGLGEFMPYTFTYTSAGTGLGKSTPITMDVAASVANADFIDVTPGTYLDTVTLTITP